jgi:hypothetical protein
MNEILCNLPQPCDIIAKTQQARTFDSKKMARYLRLIGAKMHKAASLGQNEIKIIMEKMYANALYKLLEENEYWSRYQMKSDGWMRESDPDHYKTNIVIFWQV